MRAAQSWLRRLAEAFLALTLAGMVICVFGNVVLRYAFGTGIVIAEACFSYGWCRLEPSSLRPIANIWRLTF
jgi:TRAP-type transport system small permease protein